MTVRGALIMCGTHSQEVITESDRPGPEGGGKHGNLSRHPLKPQQAESVMIMTTIAPCPSATGDPEDVVCASPLTPTHRGRWNS